MNIIEMLQDMSEFNRIVRTEKWSIPVDNNSKKTKTKTKTIMKPIKKLIFTCALGLLLSPAAYAAPITWGSATVIAASTDIQTAGVTNLEGADFGLTNGTTTTVNNGAGETGGVNVAFKSLLHTQTVTLSNGITVDPNNFNFNANAGNGTIDGNYGAILGRHTGVFSNSGTILLSGLVINTLYQIQVFTMGGDTAQVSIGGSPNLSVGGGNNPGNSSGVGATVVGTFIADATTQTLTLSANTGEPTINALTIGTVVPEPSIALLGSLSLLGLLRRRRN